MKYSHVTSKLGPDLVTVIVIVEKTLGEIFQHELELPVSQATIGGHKTATFIYNRKDLFYFIFNSLAC